MFNIIQAGPHNLKQIVPLFDRYRVFYNQASDIKGAEKFLKNLIDAQENIIFLAIKDEVPVGFTQLYKTYSSVTMQPFYILNDLFVDQAYRNLGVGELLLRKAKVYCKNKGYKGLALETATENPAQKLYERLGWDKDIGFIHYFWKASE